MTNNHDRSIAFVRTEDVPAAPPPPNAAGPTKWLKDNLFATIPNSILTIVALLVIYLILQGTLPWLLNGVWVSPSLSVCRDILDGATGACFAVLTERWNQLLFGFQYPADLYWRPGLAFILLFFAAAPVLFFDLPRKLLIFTALYPFIAFYLIWGGSILTPIVALVGVVAGAAVYQRYVKGSFALGFFAGIVAALIVWNLGGLIIPDEEITEGAMRSVASRDLGGFMLNMMLGVTCVSLSVPLGIALALGRQSSMPLIKYICVIFIEFIRGVPLITLLFVASVMLSYFFPPEATVDLFLRVVIMITMFSAAYIAEVIRGGLAALPKGQYEAGDSLGLDYAQSMRLIILPQALKISIPGIVNVAVGLFKDTTLVSVISMFDLVGMIRGPILASTDWQGIYWELFGFAALLFFVVCYGISQYSQWLERRLATDHR
ncbi:amino acid ABC transporter permease [Yoonia sediminilitoris]|uniref:L-glutamine ABC transporter membrane protein /L-glutamate ABC transporter membrane protein /L-aspartate ABC transporter membrane protein /L-asparagine ABC transporter membrane protein n=1 Tax=Yoonia sediminilitoris TaxID=1286148 RepID=A0A2T6KPC6_9RHOB|nr:amino acid ABC transporter permease [Yoonia sediminilitoris]PUB18426.1 L-glutamine ABC transporter membrane protein /L-glutamate ABC transporter membrane protein /L-aspartate ABC transporter membrane protein /L-asparagine ABC transporter membrane protein [Yoonia sediminilitoris]RCW98594.1 L-glutamine ABC transporter membrane protein /L-glutamate ABC transporter membrane protein /L-aspartate ABC transporter membrane protein /L-asparagine ABC transporter membrane protein [Yoonia sediminilitoris]